jgi:two-component system, cell cycle sensor histidine kinase and response regulator CckA
MRSAHRCRYSFAATIPTATCPRLAICLVDGCTFVLDCRALAIGRATVASHAVPGYGWRAWEWGNQLSLSESDKPDLVREVERLRARLQVFEALARDPFARFALEHASDAIYWLEEDASIFYANQAASALLGYTRDELLAMKVYELNSELDAARWPAIWGLLKAEGKRTFEAKHRRKDGHVLPVEVTANMLVLDGVEYSCAFVRDISGRKALEQRVRQAEKMEAIGRLAGGVAHDFNNQLAGIMGCAELLRREVAGNARGLQFVDELTGAIHSASDLTSQLLAFSRRGKFLIEPVDLNRSAFEVTKILAHSIDKRVTVETSLQAGTAWTLGDPSQLQNAILNLALNARDAISGGGTITVTTRAVELDAIEIARQQLNVAPGAYVALSVKDTGAGMDAETQQRVFEPFFTTKEGHGGTGLGMAAVYGTVKNHKGAIRIDSEVGRGTEVTLYLPASRPGIPARPDTGALAPMTLQGRVMLVDDEPRLRKVTCQMLEMLGCQVVAFGDGASALAHHREHRGAIDLVLLDMVMPEVSGAETFAALRAVDPQLPVLIVSGYSQDGGAQTLIDAGAVGFLQKPFNMAELAGMLRRALRS